MRIKKIGVWVTVIAYVLSSLFSWLGYLPFNVTYAAGENKLTPLIAILVEKDLYPSISSDLQWYGASYLPKQNPGADSLILQIDTDKYDAIALAKMLENIYFDGLKNDGSRLVGIVLVGKIPLPVINNQGYIFPSIYPYVDFLEQKYVFDPISQYFIPNKDQKGQAEVWHGILNFEGTPASYSEYFKKLKAYDANPSDFVSKRIWYDDFVALKNGMLDQKLASYVNSQIFSEDLMYNRYHHALLKYLKGTEEGKNIDLLMALAKDLREIGETQQAEEIEQSTKEAKDLGETTPPTLFLKKNIDNFLANYQETIGTPILTTMKENIEASDRRDNYDSHIEKLNLKDQVFAGSDETMGLIMSLNEGLEKYIDDKVKKENYAMKTIIPTSFAKSKLNKIKRLGITLGYAKILDDVFRFYYFGKDALRVSTPLDLSIYRGTYRNIPSIQGTYSSIINDAHNPAKLENDATNLSQKGVGASYDLFSFQVEANRGYNPINTMEEYDLYQTEKIHKKENIERTCSKCVFSLPKFLCSFGTSGRELVPCKEWKVNYRGKCEPGDGNDKNDKDCESFEGFSMRIWGGASPLNLDMDILSSVGKYVLKTYDPKSAWRWIYDIAGAQGVKNPEKEATSYLAKDAYLSPTLVKTVDQKKITAYDYPTFHDIEDEFDYFTIIKKPGIIFSPIGKGMLNLKQAKKSKTDIEYEYSYKVIDTMIKHDSTISDQINGYSGKKYSESNEFWPYYQQIKNILSSFEQGTGNSKGSSEQAKGIIDRLIAIKGAIQSKNWVGSGVEQDIQDISKEINSFIANLDSLELLLAQDPGKGIEDVLKIVRSSTFKKDKKTVIGNSLIQIQAIPLFSEWYEDIINSFQKLEIVMTNLYSEIAGVIQQGNNIEGEYLTIYNYVENQAQNASGDEEVAFWDTTTKNLERIGSVLDALKNREESSLEFLSCIITPLVCKIKVQGNPIELDDKRKGLSQAKEAFEGTFFSEKENPEVFYQGMDLTTPDRPIDSPRYLSFQGVGASEVKIIYPNFFKVEVIDGGKLKKPEEIAESIKVYLKNKVKEYNALLQEQKNQSSNLIQDVAYQRLASVDLLATPTLNASVRSYASFTYEELLDAIGGEKMLNTLAWSIYFQNSSNKERSIQDSVLEDLIDIKKHYNINEKIGLILDTYLSQKYDTYLEKEKKLYPEYIIPTFESTGYEVGFINTDGNDYITTNILDYTNVDTLSTIRDPIDYRSPYLDYTEVHEETTICDFDYNDALLVYDLEKRESPRIEGLKCRYEDLKKKPFQLTITRNNTSLNGLLAKIPGLDDELVNSGAKSFVEEWREDDRKKFKDNVENTINFYKLPNPQKESQDGGWSARMNTIVGYTQIGFEQQKISVDQGTGKMFFGSSKDFGAIAVKIATTGDNCLVVQGKNTCDFPVSFSVNPFKKDSLPLQLAKNKIGVIYLTIELCESGKCAIRQHSMFAVPGKPTDFSLHFPHKEGILAGAYLPVDLMVKDRFGNQISRDIFPYLVTADRGNFFLGSEERKDLQISDFKNTEFGYVIPYGSNGLVKFKITDQYGTGIHGNPPVVQTMHLINGDLKMIESLGLEQKQDPLTIPSGENVFLNRNVAKEVEITLVDSAGNPLPIDIKILLTTENSILQPYMLNQVKQTKNGKTFVRESLKKVKRLELKKGKGSFWLVAGKKTGQETIKALIPGLPEKILKVDVTGKEEIPQKVEIKDKFFLGNAIESGLNIMYLNLFGSDRGNQWGYLSDNNKFVENIIGKSDRTLAVTTELVTPDHVMKTSVLVNSSGFVTNNDNLLINTHVDKSGILMDFDNYGTLKIPNFNPEVNIYLSPDSEERVLQDISEKKNKTIIIYNPEIEVAYKDSALWDKNGDLVRDQKGGSDLRITNEYLGANNVWGLYFKGQKIASAVLLNIEMDPDTTEKTVLNDAYLFEKVFDKGSSNKKKTIALLSKAETLDQIFKNYSSIENSYDLDEYIGFRADFKNITLFGGGQSVGEATLPFGSEFLINIGDPALKRIDENENIVADGAISLYHGGLGQVLYNTTTKTILKVKDIDYNRDGLRDLLVFYNDGVVSLQKQYANGKFMDMGTLMLIANGIEKVFVGDVDKNGYEDIMIKNNKNQLRVYTNDAGVFDVDGYPVCLDVAREKDEKDPSDLWGVQQIFFEDMDLDGALDIIAVDRLGYLKIFYGGMKKGGATYLSKEKNKCDEEWKSRQDIKLVDQIKVVKRSDIHSIRENPEESGSSDAPEIVIDAEDIVGENLMSTFQSPDFGNQKISIKNTLDRLLGIDFSKGAKEALKQEATISSSTPDSAIPYPDRVIIENVHSPDFFPEYPLQIPKDAYLDITIVSEDGCDKTKRTHFNAGGSRIFTLDKANLQILANLEMQKREKEIQAKENDISNQLGEVENNSDPRKIPFMEQIKEAFKKENLFDINGNSVNVLQGVDELLEGMVNIVGKYEKDIQDIADGLCNGFSFGKNIKTCEGLPVPFNQAFLAPGNYHIMGCIPLEPLTRTIGKGVPVFSIPTIGPVSVLGVPVPPFWPINFNGAGGIFGGNTSQFRIYVAPTLTAQVGIAFCFGPYGVASRIKGFIGELGGNCIVTSFPLPCPDKQSSKDERDSTYTKWAKDYGNTKTCNASALDFTDLLIPEREEKSLTNWGGSVGGLVDFSYQKSDKQGVEIAIDGVKIQGRSATPNKIIGGIQKGIQKKIMGRLDDQVEYIKNNLLRFSLTIRLPDFTPITRDLGTINKGLATFNATTTPSRSIDTAKNYWEDGKDGIKTLLGNYGKTGKDAAGEENNVTITSIETIPQKESAFDILKKTLNATDLLSITTKDIDIKIPFIYPEDIEAYANYLRIWRETNKDILDERGALIKTTIAGCDADKSSWDNERRAKCLAAQKAQQKYVQMVADFDKLNEQIFQNIEVLEKYKRFPLEVYERMHVSERYLAEISGMITNTFGYLNYWLNALASRYSQWADALITIISVIKTYQILIDFSINWNEKCGKCTIDTYDQYSCKFNALLPNLPVLPIPHIKIPNLILDFSHINLGMDIVLPKFNFVPEHIELLRLPNIPVPPALVFDLNFDLPEIPLLPDPPTLPDLPSFVPTINIELPNLPPAPKIPEIPNKITGVINALKKIANVYCVIKSGVGLVAEPAVKSRIEQMTQRNYLVPWVDSFDLTRLFKPTILQGLDYQIDTYLDIEYNFDGFYNFLGGIANDLNNLTYSLSQSPTNLIDVAEKKLGNALNQGQNRIDRANIDIEMNVDLNPQSYHNEALLDKNSLITQLLDAEKVMETKAEKKAINSIVQLAKMDSDINVDFDALFGVQEQVKNTLDLHQKNIQEISLEIRNDYPKFLASLDQQNQKQQRLQLTYTTPVFKENTDLKKLFGKENNPYETLLKPKQERIDYMIKTLGDDYSLSSQEYSLKKEELMRMEKILANYHSIAVKDHPGSETLVAVSGGEIRKPLFAQSQGGTSNSEKASTDYSKYIKGVIIDEINTVYSEYNVNKIIDYYQVDLNSDRKPDFIAWDNHNVYLKMADELRPKGKGGSLSIITPNLDLHKNNNYTTTQKSFFGSNQQLKTMDESWEVKNFKVVGQTFDSLSFAWDNNVEENNSGYLLKLSENVAHWYEKIEKKPKYVLIVPYNSDLLGKNFIVEGKKYSIQNALKSDIYEIKYFNPSNLELSTSLTEIPRLRKYIQIAALSFDGTNYEVKSPWSNQIVAGRQIIADNQPPEPKVRLVRKRIPEVVAEGTALRGYVGTYYDLVIDREDNIEVKEVAIAKEGVILAEKEINAKQGSIELKDLFYTKVLDEKYTIRGVDSEGNEFTDTVFLRIQTPKINIVDIQQFSGRKEGLKNPLKITAQWDMDIDKGNVTIQRLRNGIISNVIGIEDGKEKVTCPVGIGQTTLSRQRVDYGNLIGMYNENKILMAQLDPETGEIIVEPEYLEQLSIEVDFSQGYPVVKVIDIKTRKILFTIFLQAEALGKVEIKQGSLTPLSSNAYGIYAGGNALLIQDKPVLYIAPSGHVGVIDKSLRGTYSFDQERKEVVFTIRKNAFGEELLKVFFKVKPYSQ